MNGVLKIFFFLFSAALCDKNKHSLIYPHMCAHMISYLLPDSETHKYFRMKVVAF